MPETLGMMGRDHALLEKIRTMREKQRYGCSQRQLSFDEAEHEKEVAFERSHRQWLPSKVFYEGSFGSEETAGRLEA